MRRKIITILMLCIYIVSNAQNTWSKEYDLGQGRKNFVFDMVIVDSVLFVTSEHFCPSIDPLVFPQCNILSKFSTSGSFIDEIIYEKSGLAKNSSLITIGNKLYTFQQPDMGSIDTFESLSIYNLDPREEVSKMVNFSDDNYTIASGISKIRNDVFLYGTLVKYDYSEENAFFAKLDDSLNVKIINKYPARQLNVFMNDLQPTPDGNLAFILKQRGPAGPSGWSGYEIYKVDKQGEVIDSFVFKEGFGLDWPYNLTIDEAGNYYFYSDKHPVEGFPPSIGRLNKLSKDMKTLEWSVILPNSTYGREYRIEESILARNGDIVICGSVYDHDMDYDGPHTTHNGFITRFDQEGNIVWHHIYKVPNDEYLPQSEYGRYRFSRLTKIVETEDGSLLAGGNHAYHWTVYDHPDFDDTKESNLLWLLKVDADGCLEGEECGEVIEIGRGIQSNPVFTIGTKWTYDYSPVVIGGPFGQDSLQAGYIEFEIVDTFRRNDSLFYSFGDEQNGYMYQDGEKIYLAVQNVGLQLTYDFENDQQYLSSFINPRNNQIDTAIVNITVNQNLFDFGDRGLQSIQNLSIDNNGTYEDMPLNADILYHCGKMYGGLPLGLGLGLSDPPYIIGKLRCFEQGDFSFNFTGSEGDSLYVSCDSVRYISATIDEITKVSISPNPFTYKLNISIDNPRPLTGNILNIHGRILKSFDLNNRKNLTIDLESLPASMYIVDIKDEYGKQLYREKIIKIN